MSGELKEISVSQAREVRVDNSSHSVKSVKAGTTPVQLTVIPRT